MLVLIIMFPRKKRTLKEVYYYQLPQIDMENKCPPMTKDFKDLIES